jgi:hypothetical protein
LFDPVLQALCVKVVTLITFKLSNGAVWLVIY